MVFLNLGVVTSVGLGVMTSAVAAPSKGCRALLMAIATGTLTGNNSANLLSYAFDFHIREGDAQAFPDIVTAIERGVSLASKGTHCVEGRLPMVDRIQKGDLMEVGRMQRQLSEASTPHERGDVVGAIAYYIYVVSQNSYPQAFEARAILQQLEGRLNEIASDHRSLHESVILKAVQDYRSMIWTKSSQRDEEARQYLQYYLNSLRSDRRLSLELSSMHAFASRLLAGLDDTLVMAMPESMVIPTDFQTLAADLAQTSSWRDRSTTDALLRLVLMIALATQTVPKASMALGPEIQVLLQRYLERFFKEAELQRPVIERLPMNKQNLRLLKRLYQERLQKWAF